jgi:ABC-2 type transport system ATP-binding protein
VGIREFKEDNLSAIVKVEDLTYEYPTARALDNVSFTIAKASITALVGPNGAGKTTLLRCIAGLEFPLTGEITIDGCPVFDNPRRIHRYIGYLSDSFGLYDALTVNQCLEYAARSQHLADDILEQAIQETADKLKITEHLTQEVGTLSRGMRQRVAIAQAIIHKPRLLLLDEPASGLDPDARHDLSELFCQLKNAGMTLIISSHILAELKEYSTDMLVLRKGKLLQHGIIADNVQPPAILLEIQLAFDQPELTALLSAMAGVSGISANGTIIRCRLDESKTKRLDVLQQLIHHGFQVNHFIEVNDMQQNYLDIVHGADRHQQSAGN